MDMILGEKWWWLFDSPANSASTQWDISRAIDVDVSGEVQA